MSGQKNERNEDEKPEQKEAAPDSHDASDGPEEAQQLETESESIAAIDGDAMGADINLDEIVLDPVTALELERDSLKDQATRALAEAENVRRRTERELAQARRYGHSGFARDLLAVVENLSRAVDALPSSRDHLDEGVKNLVVGVEMIARELEGILEKHGITRIDPLGEKFDPDRHQAMFEVKTSEAEPGTVVQVARPGWMLHDRLLSAAMVGVAAADRGSGEEK